VALQGTLRDFGLPDILQLIGIQRKTGILVLERDNESVELKFLDGRVVGAENSTTCVEDLLGQVLVRTGKITGSQLSEALRLQRQTLQRLGHILVRYNYISEEELVEALRVQSLQIIYRLFRWRDGKYNVRTVEDLDYDEQHFTPIGTETILMEGARMVDEWPIIERRIKTASAVFERTEAADGLELDVESVVDQDIDFQFVFDDTARDERKEKEPSLCPEELQILCLVDGQRTVQDINDRSALGDFDTYRILSELVTRDLIREIKRVRVGTEAPASQRGLGRLMVWAAGAVLALSVGLALLTVPHHPLAPWRVGGNGEGSELLRFHASHARLEQIEHALQVHYLDRGAFPTGLRQLADGDYLRPTDLLDPWGRAYEYRLSAGGYQIFGHDGAGATTPELSLSRPFSAVQRMMVAPDLEP